MADTSRNAASRPAPGNEQDPAVPGGWRRAESQALLTALGPRLVERVGRWVGASGSTLAIVGFALPIASGPFQLDGYRTFLLLLPQPLGGNWAFAGLGWELVPLVLLLLVTVLAAPLTLSLATERVTARFPRLSLGLFGLSCLLLWSVVGVTFCLAAALIGPVAFGAWVLLSFRTPAQSAPWMYALVPLAGLLGYGGGIVLYLAHGVYWIPPGTGDLDPGSQISPPSVGSGFWLCAAGWLLATLGGTLLWQVRRQAHSC